MDRAPDTSQTDPLAGHRLFQTREVDAARAEVARRFCTHRLSPRARRDTFETCHNRAAGRAVSLNLLRYGAEVEIDPGALESFYLVQIPLRGTATIRHGNSEIATGADTASILNPTLPTRMTWHGGCCKLLVQIDRATLHRQAEHLTGYSLRRPPIFAPALDRRTAVIGHWLRLVRGCVGAAEERRAFVGAGSGHQVVIEEDLVCALLAAQPSTISHCTAPQRSPAPRQIRRARDYIHTHLCEPITATALARLAGCSIRSLQQGFRMLHGCSPMTYLHNTRLDLARHLLATAPPTTCVGDVADEVGFAHAGRFAGAYRARFGEAPRATLARGHPGQTSAP